MAVIGKLLRESPVNLLPKKRLVVTPIECQHCGRLRALDALSGVHTADINVLKYCLGDRYDE